MMIVSQVMRREVLTVDMNATVKEAATLMAAHCTSGLPVMNGDKVVGMITESDIVQMSIPGILQLLGHVPEIPGLDKYFDGIKDLGKKQVREIVNTHGAVTTTEEVELGKAIALMVAKNVKKLPVLRGEKLVGTITYSDIIALMAKTPD